VPKIKIRAFGITKFPLVPNMDLIWKELAKNKDSTHPTRLHHPLEGHNYHSAVDEPQN
jgi:hypothetical protein